MVVCSLCKRDGHLKKDCPEDFKKVQLDPLPLMTPEFFSVLNKVCEQCYSKYSVKVSILSVHHARTFTYAQEVIFAKLS